MRVLEWKVASVTAILAFAAVSGILLLRSTVFAQEPDAFLLEGPDSVQAGEQFTITITLTPSESLTSVGFRLPAPTGFTPLSCTPEAACQVNDAPVRVTFGELINPASDDERLYTATFQAPEDGGRYAIDLIEEECVGEDGISAVECLAEAIAVDVLEESPNPERPYRVFAIGVARTPPSPVINVPSTVLFVGESRTVDVTVTSPAGAGPVHALTIDIGYDSDLVTAACAGGQATCNPIYPCNASSPASCEPQAVRLVDARLGAITGLIESIRFTGVAPGTFTYSITVPTCSNLEGTPLNCQVNGPGGVLVEGGGLP